MGEIKHFVLILILGGLLTGPILAASSSTLVHRRDLTQAHLGDTAYTVNRSELLLSLRQVSYGLWDNLSVETVPLYDLLGSWNLFGKVRIFRADPIAVSARAGMFYITLEQLPEVQNSALYRYFIGATASVRLSEVVLYHLNLNNTSLQGDFLSSNRGPTMKGKLTNVENDVEYRFDDKRTVLVGTGYDLKVHKFSLGASHLWTWSSLFLKLGLTFKTTAISGMSMLPYFDLGIRI